MEDLVFKGENGQVFTNSLLVAQKFGREHKHVLASIRNLLNVAKKSTDKDLKTILDMFVLSKRYVPLNNNTCALRPTPVYLINRDGFSLLSMSFTGIKALVFKMQYIQAFNEMEAKQKEDKPDMLSEIELIVKSANALLDHERRLKHIEGFISYIFS